MRGVCHRRTRRSNPDTSPPRTVSTSSRSSRAPKFPPGVKTQPQRRKLHFVSNSHCLEKMQPRKGPRVSYPVKWGHNMQEAYISLLLIVVVVCSYLSVKAWIDARRMEREAFYRTEALKKIAELQENVSEPELEALRHAVEQSDHPRFRYDYN